jgi:hypothetical protein
MTMNPDDPRDLLRRLAVGALGIATVCSMTAWAHTVCELNSLTAYQPVGGEALRVARPVRKPAGPIRLARERRSAALPGQY